MIIVSIPPQAESGPIDHRKDALHFIEAILLVPIRVSTDFFVVKVVHF